MKYTLAFLFVAAAMTPKFSVAAETTKCEREVTAEIEGKNQFNVVEQVHTKDEVHYVVIFRTASGDAEQASVAVVTVYPANCSVENVKYVRGDH